MRIEIAKKDRRQILILSRSFEANKKISAEKSDAWTKSFISKKMKKKIEKAVLQSFLFDFH